MRELVCDRQRDGGLVVSGDGLAPEQREDGPDPLAAADQGIGGGRLESRLTEVQSGDLGVDFIDVFRQPEDVGKGRAGSAGSRRFWSLGFLMPASDTP